MFCVVRKVSIFVIHIENPITDGRTNGVLFGQQPPSSGCGEMTGPDLLVLVSPAVQVSYVAAYARIQRWISELVLLDINRGTGMLPLLLNRENPLLSELQGRPILSFDLTIVGSDSAGPGLVSVRRRARGGSQWQETPTDMRWPANVFSLSHVALPFSAEDPMYGPNKADGLIRLGELWFKGEQGVLGVPLRMLARQRYNPFFPYMERRVIEAAELIIKTKKGNYNLSSPQHDSL
ncbi:MAG: hypothetical protein V7696_15465 [Halioglobus sp.]